MESLLGWLCCLEADKWLPSLYASRLDKATDLALSLALLSSWQAEGTSMLRVWCIFLIAGGLYSVWCQSGAQRLDLGLP